MAVNYLMVSSDDGQLPFLVMAVNYHVASSDDGLFTSWLLVMTVNYLMVMVASSDDGQLPHGF